MTSQAPGLPSPTRNAVVALVIFIVSQLVLVVGISVPDKLVFDEAHYVPAARQMREAVPSQPQLNPMHPPLAKELIALSIGAFGDNPFGWRFVGTSFGALAVVAIYLCGLALLPGQGPAIAAAVIALCNQMLFVQARTAMLDIFALAFSLLAIAAFLHGYRQRRPLRLFMFAGANFGLAAACKWSGVFPLVTVICLVAAVRLLQAWGTTFAGAKEDDWYRPDLWADLSAAQIVWCFLAVPVFCYVATFIPIDGLSPSGILAAQKRIFADSITTAIAGHTYMSAWPTWPLLVRPVWLLFDKSGDDTIAAVMLLGNPLVLWPALAALAICLCDWIVTRRDSAFLIIVFYLGCYLPWALLPRELSFLYYYLPSATLASLALPYAMTRCGLPRWLLWTYVLVAIAGFAVMLPISVAFIGTSMATFNRLMLFQSWI